MNWPDLLLIARVLPTFGMFLFAMSLAVARWSRHPGLSAAVGCAGVLGELAMLLVVLYPNDAQVSVASLALLVIAIGIICACVFVGRGGLRGGGSDAGY